MALSAEVNVEPFVDDPGPLVRAAVTSAEEAGLTTEFGPLGTTVTGEDTAVLDAVDGVVRAAVAAGATRLVVQYVRPDA